MKKLGFLAMGSALLLTVHNTALAQTTEKTILDDPMNSATFVNQASDPYKFVGRKAEGGSFGSFLIPSTGQTVQQGWKPTGDANLVCYDLGQYIENGSLEIQVTQFEPRLQNSALRHHVLAMFRTPWRGHHPVEKLDTFWDLHTGTQHEGGFKFLSNTYYSSDEKDSRTSNDIWNKDQTYTLKIVWNANSVDYFRNGVSQLLPPIGNGPHPLLSQMQLRYIYVGRDRTVGADNITGFMNNQYPAMWSDGQGSGPDDPPAGPIYSNLVVKEWRSTETVAPVISSPTIVNLYENAARLSWSSTNEPAVCYVEYGPTTTYSKKDTVLGPPATSFTTLLSNLNASTLYHYRITAMDDAGNVSQSSDLTFTLPTNGIYVFKPVADTYIERNRDGDTGTYSHLYGPTRALGNYGWMNLMSADGRYCYLKFQIPNSLSNIRPFTLRLYSRQGGQGGVTLYQFDPVSPDWESNVTWADQSSVGGQSGDGFQDSDGGKIGRVLGSVYSPMLGGQWYSFNFASPTKVVSKVEGNFIAYYFAFQGSGDTPPGTAKFTQDVSFDSRESTNNQPELILRPVFTEITTALPGVSYPALAWGDYDRDGDMDILLTGSLGGANVHSKIWNNDGSGNFTGTNITPAVSSGAVAWGDYDKNNSLDFLLTGQDAAGKYTKVYQNSGSPSFTFAAISTSLEALSYNGAAWGDYNKDRHVDILLCGTQAGGTGFAQIYKATSTGVWVNSGIALEALKDADAEWGDYDRDGDLDVLLSGFTNASVKRVMVYKNLLVESGAASFESAYTTTPQVLKRGAWVDYDQDGDLDFSLANDIYENTGASFVEKNFGIPDTYNGDSAWGDFDNDGDLDLLLTGEQSSIPVAKIYRNDFVFPVRTFVDISESDIIKPFVGLKNSAVAWGDYDADGDLDILMAGLTSGGVATTKLYRNNTSTTNGLPAAPVNLATVVTDNNVKLTWNLSTDAETGVNALTYNIMMGPTVGSIATVSPMSMVSNGRRLMPAVGKINSNTNWTMVGLPLGTYNWKVQAIDQTFKGSVFSANASFTVTSSSPKIAETDSIVDAIAKQAIPQTFALSQNYPNPFNPTTRLNLELPENGRVKAIVYDLTGQEVVRLRDAAMTAGYKYLNWDGKNNFGATVGSGTYLVKVVFEGVSGMRKESTSRILLVK